MKTLSERLRSCFDDGASTDSIAPLANPTTIKQTSFAWLQTVSRQQVERALALLLDAPAEEWLADRAIASIWVELVRRQQTDPVPMETTRLLVLERVYRRLAQRPTLRALMLRWLANTPQREARETFARLMAEQPLDDPRSLIEIFGDLVARAEADSSTVFPQLLEGLKHRQQAGFVLDFANHLVRHRLVKTHPAAAIADQLQELLSGIATRLGALQESRPTSQEQLTELGRQVTESVSLGISLCDAMGLIGDADAIPALNKTLAVEHRRLRVEAAAALARLGHPDGGKLLIAMAAEPSERIRVLTYLDELDLLDQVPDECSGPVARAEAALVMHLAQPTLFGLPPRQLELVAEKTQYWPGFEEPRNCYLFQFLYQLPAGEFTNIGIAGPVVYSLHADLTSLAHDDIFAIFAGWHVQHPDILAIDADKVVGQDQIDLHRLAGHLRNSDQYAEVVPVLLGHFLGRRLLIAAARRGELRGWVTISDDSHGWLPAGNPQQPLGAGEAFYLFVGRALLKSFN